jgi:hypothetical protein
MTSESKLSGRRSAVLAAVIGAVLATSAGSALAVEYETDGGTKINWNTTLSVGSSWRAGNPDPLLYTMTDGAVIGKYRGAYTPGTRVAKGNGLAGNDAAGDSNLNYARGDRFSTPLKLISDLEVRKGSFGGLVRFKAWYDEALENGDVLFGNQANQFNGTSTKQTQFGPSLPNCFPGLAPNPFLCMPVSPPGVNVWPQQPLSDNGFEDEQKFSNVYLLDAYLYGTFALGNTDLQVRLGNQVINWGESVFIQGVNQVNPIDVPAARRAGAELKEILLPVWAAYLNWGTSFGSIEAFYQFKWNNTSIDSCGTYFGQTNGIISADPGGCRSATPITPVVGSALPQSGSNPFSQYNGLYVPLVKGREPSDSGQFGVAFRFPIDAIDTEIGLYGMNIHSRMPMASGYGGTSLTSLTPQQQALLLGQIPGVPLPAIAGIDAVGPYFALGSTRLRGPAPIHSALAAIYGQAVFGAPIELTPGTSFWEYPEDMQIFGLSTASNLGGWSVSSELSFQQDVPVQINGNDLLNSLLVLIGPNAKEGLEVYAANDGVSGRGTAIQGYDRFDKTQFQVNALKTFSNYLGADNILVIGEVGAQWNDVPDYTKGTVRYGRGFMHGHGSSPAYAVGATAPTLGNTCSPVVAGLPPNATVPSSLYNPSPIGCRNDGYVTDFAWGYRVRLSADYSNLLGSGITMTPSVFWSQDVEGVSMDPAFIEDRSVLGLGVKFSYNKKYTFDVNYVQYGDSGYDPLFDRDYYSASVAVTF